MSPVTRRGTAIVLYTEREASTFGHILKACKATGGESVGAPEPAEVMMAASR